MRKLPIAPISGALALLLAAPLSAPRAAEPAGACGTVVMFDKSLKKEGIYAVGLIEIDGKAPLRRKYDHTLSEGTHVLKLGEMIPLGEQSASVQRYRDRTIRNKELTLEVKANERYVIAAKLNKDKMSDVNAYWTPLVIKDEPKACKPE
jgi:hypothetical protein